MDELLAILGGSWRQVLLYPGGLTMILLLLVTTPLWRRRTNPVPSITTPPMLLLLQITATWLCCAALPWPKTYWAYPLDLWTAYMLLEVPQWLRWRAVWHTDSTTRVAVGADLGAVLGSYPAFVLVLALFVSGGGSLLLPDLKQGHAWVHWLAVGVWAVCLPPLLQIGPWQSALPPDAASNLRRLGHCALLAVVALPGGDTMPVWAGVAAMAMTLLCFLGLSRVWRGSPTPWERWQPALVAGALLALLWQAAQGLVARLH